MAHEVLNTVEDQSPCPLRGQGDWNLIKSGDGYGLLDAEGNIVAWTLDKKWALRILLALELEQMEAKEQGNK